MCTTVVYLHYLADQNDLHICMCKQVYSTSYLKKYCMHNLFSMQLDVIKLKLILGT